ncbi:MAG: molybdopterin-dependent oxidoreductase [Deltaproteobacteria bacterium]|nr:molybdopterin-dependent oxidoreductase [Deltaproteobacteria bacterium]
MKDRPGQTDDSQAEREPTPISPSGAERFDRRNFLKLLGAGAGLAATGCGETKRYLYPYVVPARENVPGIANWYSTVCRECPAGCGVWARVREGRPVKLEGNPAHPVNHGTLCPRGQGALLRLYDPKRTKSPERRTAHGWISIPWDEALTHVERALRGAVSKKPGRAAALTGLETGTLAGLWSAFLHAFGGRHLMSDPHSPEALLSAHRAVFGRYDLPRFALESCDLVVAIESDLFETFLSPVELAGQLVGPRHAGGERAAIVWIGPRRGVTGILADEWLPIRPGTGGHVALALLLEIARSLPATLRGSAPRDETDALARDLPVETLAARAGIDPAPIRRLALRIAAATRPVVLAGGTPFASTHGVAAAVAGVLLSQALGNYGKTLLLGAPSTLAKAAPTAEQRELLRRMEAGEIDVLFVHGADPLFELPASAGVEAALAKVPMIVSLDARPTATTERAHLRLPATTPLESWGDYSPRSGVEGLLQPVVTPLVDARHPGDVLLALARATGHGAEVGGEAESFEALVRRRWAAMESGPVGSVSDARFREAQRRGGTFGVPPVASTQVDGSVWKSLRALGEDKAGGLLLSVFPTIRAGRRAKASGGWLDELPEPTTAAVWGAPAEIHPDLARRLGVENDGTLEVRTAAGTLRLGVSVRDSVHPDAVCLPLDGGHDGPGLARLLLADAWLDGTGLAAEGINLEVARAAESLHLYRETHTFEQHRRGVVRAKGLELPHETVHEKLPRELTDMYGDHAHAGHRWGMAVDLDRCTGCSACIVACQAENNIAVVGPEAVDYGREMAWLQLHLYWERDPAGRPIPLVTPVMCQQCDSAPCESVCPVFAAYHTPEGINGQVYNRCVGTRYCANNCPYKVRRFNWFSYDVPKPLDLQLNPDVTVRSKGVMEKCMFCVQRIREAKELAKLEDRPLGDGEIRPACAQTCPTGAIVFGDLLDPDSTVSRLVRSDRGYRLLDHLGTRPSVTYLERVVRWRV